VKRIAVWLLTLWLLACGGNAEISGDYAASHQGLSGPVDVRMTIEPDGNGRWEIGGENMPFLWSVRSGILTIHAREGAVVEGRREGDDLRVDVPGVGQVLFVRRK
jgi:hypothetical protein